jgi:hypothetical protein
MAKGEIHLNCTRYTSGSQPGYVADWLGVRENNIGNGGKHKKKELK